MLHYVYVIYSKGLNRYYIGETEDVDRRLLLHNNGTFIHSYTSRANDWKLFHTIKCEGISQARKIESHIKRMKSRKYLENLKKHPELSYKLLIRYNNP